MAKETIQIRGDRVNRLRIELELTRTGLCRRIERAAQTVRKVCNGERVTLGVARRVAEALDVRVSEIAEVPGVDG